MIIYVVATKIWYLKNVQFLLGHPVDCMHHLDLLFPGQNATGLDKAPPICEILLLVIFANTATIWRLKFA